MKSSIDDGSFCISFWMFSSVSSSHFSITLFVASSSIMSAVAFSCSSRMSATFSASGEYVFSSVFPSDASIICCSASLYLLISSTFVSFFDSFSGFGLPGHLSGLIGFHLPSVMFHSGLTMSGTTHGRAFSIGCCAFSRSACLCLFSASILLFSLSISACFLALISCACLSINICVASSTIASISACVFHSAILLSSSILFNSPCLYFAFSFQLTFSASTY